MGNTCNHTTPSLVRKMMVVSSEDGPDEWMLIDHLEGRTLRFHRKRPNAASAIVSAKIAQEKMTIVPGRKARARVVGKSGRPVSEVANGRQDISRLIVALQVP